MKNKPVVYCLMGPTGAGKTDVALNLSKHINCEIISVDSAMVYRGMDIGTAKPSLEQREQVSHHLIDICDISSQYSVAKFRKDCLDKIDKIQKRGNQAILVGGTMLYFRALFEGLAQIPTSNDDVRQQILTLAGSKGWGYLYEYLQQVDITSAQKIHPNDPQRISRALEVYMSTGVPLSNFISEQRAVNDLPFTWRSYCLSTDNRKILHARIQQRFMQMLELGFIKEVEEFYNDPKIGSEIPAMRAVGYRQIWQYLAGHIDKDTMVQKALAATRQLAKRQLTWLRHWRYPITWIEAGDLLQITARIQQDIKKNLG